MFHWWLPSIRRRCPVFVHEIGLQKISDLIVLNSQVLRLPQVISHIVTGSDTTTMRFGFWISQPARYGPQGQVHEDLYHWCWSKTEPRRPHHPIAVFQD